MANLSYRHDSKEESNIDTIFNKAGQAYDAEKNTTMKGYQDYLDHLETAGAMSLAEGLEALEVNETESPGGFPALRVGSADARTNLCRNTKSGINAILSMAAQKYQRLTPNAHLAHFDPRTRANGVLTVWEPSLERWVVYDWTNGFYQPSKSIVPTPEGKTPTNGNRRYWYQSQKHQAIKEYLTSKDYGTAFLIVMNHEDELAHYQMKVTDRIEMSLAEVWEAIASDWNDSNVKRQLTSGASRPNSSVPVSEERQAFINKLSKLSTPYIVRFDTGTGNESTILFNAADPKEKAAFLNGVVVAKPSVNFLGFEKVAD